MPYAVVRWPDLATAIRLCSQEGFRLTKFHRMSIGSKEFAVLEDIPPHCLIKIQLNNLEVNIDDLRKLQE